MSDAGLGWFGRSRSTSPTKPGKRRRSLGIMALEPRIMYDGAAAATAVAHHHHHDGVPTDPQTGGAANGATAVSAPHPSGGDGHWHPLTPSAGASTEPMPQVATWVRHPTEIVFIDSQIPDYQALVAGTKPGVEVVVLDPNSDGIQQIANFLSRHPDPDLTSIDIVAHGAAGELLLGSTNLTDGNLPADATALAQIGAALKPGGGIMLYGCNVASGTDGMQFITDLSKDAGGADVVAATHDIGMTAEGANWTLDAATGAPAANSPFTADAMASFATELGGEVQANTSGNVSDGNYLDTTAEVAALSNGNYVVAWETGNNSGARARIFNASGTALGSDFAITTTGGTFSIAGLPVNAGDGLPDGGFVVTYSNGGAMAAIFDVTAAGVATQDGSAIRVSTGISLETAVAVTANGGFMVVWNALTAIDGQLYDAAHNAIGGAFQISGSWINQYQPDYYNPHVAVSGSHYMVTWGGYPDSNADDQIFEAVYNVGGGQVSSNTIAGGAADYFDSEVTGLSNGDFVVAWDDPNRNVEVQIFNANGGTVSGEITVASEANGTLSPAVVADADGGFVVEWNGNADSGYGGNIGAQRFDASGNKLGVAFQLDVPAEPGSTTGGGTYQSPLAVLTNGQVVVAFTDNTSDGNNDSSVFVNQFSMHSPPSGADATKTITENQSYTLAAADFGFSDPLDGDSFAGVEITTLPTSGTLKDNGAAVTAGEIIAIADINAGHLVFTPATNSSGSPDSHFTFQVEDSGASTGPNVKLGPVGQHFHLQRHPAAAGGDGRRHRDLRRRRQRGDAGQHPDRDRFRQHHGRQRHDLDLVRIHHR